MFPLQRMKQIFYDGVKSIFLFNTVLLFKDNRYRDVYPFGRQTVEQFLNKEQELKTSRGPNKSE